MSKKLYEAAILQLRGRALESLAALELLFTNPTAIPDHTAWVAEIVKHTKRLAENENTMTTLQQYFGKHYAAPAPAAVPQGSPQAHPQEPKVITPEMSPTMRRELQRQKRAEMMKARQEAMAKQEMYPEPSEDSGLKEEKEPTKKTKRKSAKSADDK